MLYCPVPLMISHKQTQSNRFCCFPSLYFRRIRLYTMQNKFSNCFVCVRSTTSGFYCQIIASRYMRRSLDNEFPVKSRMINRSDCTSVPSGRKRHFWSYARVKTIMKRLFSHQNKEEEKEKNIIENLNMLKEIALQTLKFWRFSFYFTLSSKNGVSNRKFFNHFCVYSCLGPTNRLI